MPHQATFHALVQSLMSLGARCIVLVSWLVASGLKDATLQAWTGAFSAVSVSETGKATVNTDRSSAGGDVVALRKKAACLQGNGCSHLSSMAALAVYENAIERWTRLWPTAWHLVVAADDKCRAEHIERSASGVVAR